ncbi:hypothetical protein BR93DRAFT_610600 [Coniochaeta sp. PMI_546]|nr:hypothetical protein BR93DRAFT_610600 [Coniochaeta sp. PMI_546]
MSGDMTILSHRWSTKLQRSLVIILFCLFARLFWPLRCDDGRCDIFEPSVPTAAPPKRLDRELVVAKRKHEDTAWIGKYLPDWPSSIYVTDDPRAQLTVPVNKGREAMVYLTYIIDRYDTLPDTAIFLHASRFQWHNDNPDYDGLLSLRNLSFPYIQEEGYVNLRCVWVLGCPVQIRPAMDAFEAAIRDPAADQEVTMNDVFKSAFEELLPDSPVPEEVGVPCCSQFAVTRATIQRRPREDYTRFRDWLTETGLNDNLSGRVLEYSWHVIFGKDAVHCPSASHCYCKLYGQCNLTCTRSECEDRYVLPPFSSLPSGWPRLGWKGEERQFESPLS